MADLLLSGRPASRIRSRYYEHNETRGGDDSPTTGTRRESDRHWQVMEDESDLMSPVSSDRRITGYETVNNTSTFNNKNYHHRGNVINDSPQTVRDSYTPRQSMSRTRNKYRPKISKPSECDDTLFGKREPLDYKEWKAPWDHSKTEAPLLFDSSDRAGHYTPAKRDKQSLRQSYSANGQHRRAWR